jgi:hypothetical protein
VQDALPYGAIQLGNHGPHKLAIGRLLPRFLQKSLELGLHGQISLLVAQIRVDSLYSRLVARHSLLQVGISGKYKRLPYLRISGLSRSETGAGGVVYFFGWPRVSEND